MELKAFIRSVPDFPKPGILFRDIAPLLADPGAFTQVVSELVARYRSQGCTCIAAVESRGFLLGAPLALGLGVRLVPIRKAGKLPGAVLRRAYALEYGEAALEVQADALTERDRVVLLDDLLATGGTARAAAELVEEAGAEVLEAAFLIELAGLGGRKALAPRRVWARLRYEEGEP